MADERSAVAEYRTLVMAAVKQFESDLTENQESRIIFLQGGREVSMRLSAVQSDEGWPHDILWPR